MAETIFETLSRFFAEYGYWVIFFGVMFENAGLLVPGETVLLFAGFLAYQGEISLWRAILVGFLGASLGDSFGYVMGRYGGTRFVKYARRFRWLRRRFDQSQATFHDHGHWAVFVGRFVTGLRVFAGPLAGMFRMRYSRFLFFNVSGALLWAMTIASVGFLFGGSWEHLVDLVRKFHEATLAGGVVLLVVIGVVYVRRRRREPPEAAPPVNKVT